MVYDRRSNNTHRNSYEKHQVMLNGGGGLEESFYLLWKVMKKYMRTKRVWGPNDTCV